MAKQIFPGPMGANNENPVVSLFNRVFNLPGRIQNYVSGIFLNSIDRIQTEQAVKEMHAAIEKERRQKELEQQQQQPEQ